MVCQLPSESSDATLKRLAQVTANRDTVTASPLQAFVRLRAEIGEPR